MPHGDRAFVTGCVAALLWAGPAAAEPAALQGGAYEVEVRLELPHLEDAAPVKTARICLAAQPGSDNHGISVLSDNNPLARCPMTNVSEEAGRIRFDIVCEGKNAARARASYVLAPERFQGRIVMQMGGKNMTMTEVQAGRRVGPCDAGRAPAL